MRIPSDIELFELVDKLSLKYFNKHFVDKVYFNTRLRTTGGRYLPSKRVIELNPKYVIESNKEEFYGIIKHELCHYHLHIEGKGYNHGDREFKELLKATGSPRHCSPLPSQQRKHRYEYQCNQCGFVYKRIRKVNMKKYRCGKCRGSLKEI
ncbi:SprT family protein [Oceanobacillus kimchii]|uniref:SprT family protein n=1 Tax=Oceanobacillus kimchii TaxID=746691 RepID=UPI00034C37A5|nr:SprT family protein [Oceanobacillus kimchii]MCT1577316.1 SprT family protein [Oceanobacillus kimchii]MCT2136922.1 SprT family protein [Oceanobacillus kimchii]